MERVETLLKKLQEQFAQNASPEQLLLTAQMLQAELLHLQAGNAVSATGNSVAITVSPIAEGNKQPAERVVEPAREEKTIEVLKIDEAEIEAELEEIKRNAEAMQKISIQNKPHVLFESAEEDIPTLTHQEEQYNKHQQRYQPTGPNGLIQQEQPQTEYDKKEINESIAASAASINERLKQTRIDLGDTLTEVPIRDLRKAIGVNDRFLFINELFRGDEVAYERSVKTINSFSIFPEAEYWIQRELKVKNGWNDSHELVRQFYQLVKRRFS
jgi:hypothetical protein